MSDHEYIHICHTQQHGVDHFTHQYVHEVMSQELHAQRGKPDRPLVGGTGSVQQQTGSVQQQTNMLNHTDTIVSNLQAKLNHTESAPGQGCAA